MKVYGPSLAMIDDWEQRVTQLGITSLPLLWVGECGESFCQLNSQIISYLLTRGVRPLTAATIRPPHPTWVTAEQLGRELWWLWAVRDHGM